MLVDVVICCLCLIGSCLACLSTGCDYGDKPLGFFVLGDWGGQPTEPYTTAIQRQIATTWKDFVQSHNVQFVITTGDNMYKGGVTDEKDERFKTTFEDAYSGKGLDVMPWYLTPGNHDWYGNITAQIAYTHLSYRWNFPDHFYKVTFSFSSGKVAVFLLIDTIKLCSMKHAPDVSPDEVKSYQLWLEKQLTASDSKADYIFVVGHYPVYSIAEHGSCNCMQRVLESLLTKYLVSAYIGGHDHDMQHIQVTSADAHTVHYVQSGAGAFISKSTAHTSAVPQNAIRFVYPSGEWLNAQQGGFVYAQLDGDRGTFGYYSGNGTLLYSFELHPRHTKL